MEEKYIHLKLIRSQENAIQVCYHEQLFKMDLSRKTY
jgi:hypothetical protein